MNQTLIKYDLIRKLVFERFCFRVILVSRVRVLLQFVRGVRARSARTLIISLNITHSLVSLHRQELRISFVLLTIIIECHYYYRMSLLSSNVTIYSTRASRSNTGTFITNDFMTGVLATSGYGNRPMRFPK